MKISYQWINEFVKLDVDAFSAAEALTMSGVEVEEVSPCTIPASVVSARIVEVKPHPNADKLRLCLIDAGLEEPLWVVCGAPNARAGLLTAYAPIGTDLGGGFVIKKAKIRGELSLGILLSEKELGLTDDHSGIMEIEVDLRPGTSLLSGLDLADTVLGINVTPNRGDCLSVIGIARELSAIFGKDLIIPDIPLTESDRDINELLQVEIQAKDACPRYCARVLEGVAISKSPFAMRRRLFQSDVRAINNVVDITNYILLEYGQPLHAFDYSLIGGKKIVVRQAGATERLTTLDSVERALAPSDLLICDAVKPVALAGVMGGENSEVAQSSTSIALESAYFAPVVIQRTSRRLGLSTEASYRFERGIDPEIQARAINRAAQLMTQLSGASLCKGIIDADYRSGQKPEILVRTEYLQRVLGLSNIVESEIGSIFQRLGCSVKSVAGGWLVSPPALRHDLEREIDLIEEFIRIFGMDKVIPALPGFTPDEVSHQQGGARKIRSRLSAMGLSEIVTYSFVSPSWKRWFADRLLELKNPISDEMSCMRTSLIPGLISTVGKNKNLQTKDIFIFELGRCFLANGEGVLPEEPERLGIAMSGFRRAQHWSEPRAMVDFYDIKGLAELLLPGMSLQASGHDFLDKGVQADILLNGKTIGYLGRISQEIAEHSDINDEVYILEVASEALRTRAWEGMQAIARFPMTWRDLSLIVDKQVFYAQIEDAVLSLGIEELRRIMPVDLYEGDKLPTGKKGITMRLTYQSEERTLEDKQVTAWQDRIVSTLATKLGIALRQ